MKWIKRALAFTGLALVCIFAGVLIVFWTPDTNSAEMRAKYGQDALYAPVSNGYAIHYRDEGCTTCPALMLVHGLNSSLHTWEPVVRQLRDRFRVISLDLPGHGLTGPHPDGDYTQTGADEAINAVVQDAALSQFAIAGNSLGGGVSWRYALDHPVSAVILLDPSGAPRAPSEAPPASNIGFRLMNMPGVIDLMTVITPRALIEMSLAQSVTNQDVVTSDAVDRYWELLRYPGNRRAAIDRARTDHGPSEFERLAGLDIPTLIIWGDQDALIPPARAALFDAVIPDATLLMYEGIGHLPMEEAADRTSRDIAAFLLHNRAE